MSVLSDLFQDIADAIRFKTGATDTMKPADFPTHISEIEAVSGSDELNLLIDEINGEIINGKLVTFIGFNGEVLCEVSVVPSQNCPNPVTTKLIETPTKESTETEVFTFSGWSLTEGGEADSDALKNVTEDRMVYVAFTASVRYYTVNFYDGTKLLATHSVTYGGSTEYTYSKMGYYFNEWSPAPTNITADTDCYAQWTEASFHADSWETIMANVQSGVASSIYSVGDVKEIKLTYDDGTKETITVQVVGHDVDDVSTTNDHNMTIIATTALATPMPWNTKSRLWIESGNVTGYTFDGFSGSTLYTYLNKTVKQALPSALRNILKNVNKYQTSSYAGADTLSTLVLFEELWIPSLQEIGIYDADDKNSQTKYAKAYTSDTDRVIALHDTGEAVEWWTTNIAGKDKSNCISTSGTNASGSYKKSTTYTAYVVIGFCI